MRVLIFMGGFFPGRKYGGPPVSIDNLSSLVCDNQYYVVTTNHDLGESKKYDSIVDGWNKRKNNLFVRYFSDKEYGYKQFKSSILELKPDLLYLQGLFQRCVFPALLLAKKFSIPVLLAPRGELCAGAFRKKYKKIPYIIVLRLLGTFDKCYFQSTSEEESHSIVHYLKVSPDRVCYLNNIPSLPSGNDVDIPDKRTGLASLVFLSRIVEKKNLLFAIRSLKEVSGHVLFDIYGPIEDSNYWEQCTKEIAGLPANVTVNYKGILSHDEIHRILASYHAFLFPTHSENYGHVIVESMLSGCIPIISDQTPWSDINSCSCGWALPLRDMSLFTNAIQSLIDMDEKEYCSVRFRLKEYLTHKLSLSEIQKKYHEAFLKVSNFI